MQTGRIVRFSLDFREFVKMFFLKKSVQKNTLPEHRRGIVVCFGVFHAAKIATFFELRKKFNFTVINIRNNFNLNNYKYGY